jgi:hypothetical protein
LAHCWVWLERCKLNVEFTANANQEGAGNRALQRPGCDVTWILQSYYVDSAPTHNNKKGRVGDWKMSDSVTCDAKQVMICSTLF